MSKILGISAFYHDSAVAITVDGEIIAAAQEERYSRKKHDAGFPVHSIKYCLEETGFCLDELDAVVFYDKPLLKFERLLETYYAFAPKGLRQFVLSIPIWLKEKMFLKKQIYEGLNSVEPYNKKDLKLLFPAHHMSHAASAFYPSPFSSAAILTIDGVGEWATATIAKGEGHQIRMLKEMRFPHSAGLLYSAFTYFLGFKVNSGEYKLMGLAPYGDPNSEQTAAFIKKIKDHLVTIYEDGSIWLNQEYFTYATGLKMLNESKWEKLFECKKVAPDGVLEPCHCNLAYAIQHVTEEIVLKMAKEAKRLTDSDYLCMAGGVALNCVANGKLLKAQLFKDIFIQPASGDAGGSVGAALLAHHMYYDHPRQVTNEPDAMKGSYLGPDFSDKEAVITFKKQKAVYNHIESFDALCAKVAEALDSGQVVGWFQGKMEFGPRALGNRSILADPRDKDMQKKLNLKIKYREGFRPFAPAVQTEDVEEMFDLDTHSPYMLLVAEVKQQEQRDMAKTDHIQTIWDKLYMDRGALQSITHVDFSARVQTVHKETNQRFWSLLEAFKQKTGCGVLINTSFNVRGEPIVCSPEDAYRCFMSTEMDWLVVNNYILEKTAQPEWDNREKWRTNFRPD